MTEQTEITEQTENYPTSVCSVISIEERPTQALTLSRARSQKTCFFLVAERLIICATAAARCPAKTSSIGCLRSLTARWKLSKCNIVELRPNPRQVSSTWATFGSHFCGDSDSRTFGSL